MRRIVLDAGVAVKWFLPRAGEPLVDVAFDLLRQHTHQAGYDELNSAGCWNLYVVLAVRFGAEMVTADERLANSVGARLPVKWLGTVPLSGEIKTRTLRRTA